RHAADVRSGRHLRRRRSAQERHHAGVLRVQPHVPRCATARGRVRLGRRHVPRRVDPGDRHDPAPVPSSGGQPMRATDGPAVPAAPGPDPARRSAIPSGRELDRWLARRRWSRAGIVYLVMLIFSLLLLGPLLFATLSSLKTDPLAYPPTLAPPQLAPANWAAAA